MDTRKIEDVSSKKKTHKTRKTHVEMLKKENYNAKGKLRRGHHILACQPSGVQVMSLSASARRPWSVRWANSSLWPGDLWQWSCTVLSATSWHRICQQQQELGPRVNAIEFLGAVSMRSLKWGVAAQEMLLPMLSGLASHVYPWPDLSVPLESKELHLQSCKLPVSLLHHGTLFRWMRKSSRCGMTQASHLFISATIF